MVSVYVRNSDGDWQALTPPKGGFKIQLEMVNPVFELNKLERINSFDFKIPLVPNNVKLLGHLHVIPNINRTSVQINVLVRWNSFNLECSMVIDKPFRQSTDLRAYLIAKGREFKELIKDKNLDEFELGGEFVDALYDSSLTDGEDICDDIVSVMTASASNSYPTDNWVFPKMYCQDFMNWEEDRYGQSTENPCILPFEQINNLEAGEGFGYFAPPRAAGPAYLDYETIIPFPFVSAVLKYLFDDLGYSVEGVFEDNADLKKLVLFNVRTLDKASMAVDHKDHYPSSIWIKNHVPNNLLAEDFITSLQAGFFCILLTDPIAKTARFVSIDDILNNNEAIDITNYCRPDPEIDFVDDTITFKYTYDRNNKVGQPFDESDSNFQGTVADMTALFAISGDCPFLVTPGEYTSAQLAVGEDIYYVTELDSYVSYNFKNYANEAYGDANAAIATWETTGHNFQEYTIGSSDSNRSIQVKWSPIVSSYKLIFEASLITGLPDDLMPLYKGPSNSRRFKGSDEDNPFTIGFYDTTNRTVSAHNNFSSFSLRWDGTDGLVNTFGSKLVDLYTKGRPVIYKANLPASLLSKLQNWEKPKVTVRGVRYVVKEIKVSLGQGELAEADLELVQDV